MKYYNYINKYKQGYSLNQINFELDPPPQGKQLDMEGWDALMVILRKREMTEENG